MRIILSMDRPLSLPGKITPRNTRASSPIHARKQVTRVLSDCAACVLGCSGKALHLAKRGRARAMRPHQKPRRTEAAGGRGPVSPIHTHQGAAPPQKGVCGCSMCCTRRRGRAYGVGVAGRRRNGAWKPMEKKKEGRQEAAAASGGSASTSSCALRCVG
jgi:hypothetical protein